MTEHTALLREYHTNIRKEWSEWLEYECTFSDSGNHGRVGLLRSKSSGNRYVFKVSNRNDHLIRHESNIMEDLYDITSYCPNFLKKVGVISCKCNNSDGNPFAEGGTATIQDVLLCEYIETNTKLHDYARNKCREKNVFSIVKQTLLAVAIAQKKKKFTHYDLHTNNIMVKKCNKDVVFLYVIDEENQFCVPSFGTFPVIIDFGFSYTESMEDGPLWPSMAYANYGFTSNTYDCVSDSKLLLVTTAKHIKSNKNFKCVVKNIFRPLNIDWSTGWDLEKNNGVNTVMDMLKISRGISRLFDDNQEECITLISSLIILPIQRQEYDEMHIAYEAFLKQWTKIENQITSQRLNIYILKNLIGSARKVAAAYRNKNTQKNAVIDFQREVCDTINSVVKFCRTHTVNFEIMLCSLYVLTTNIEGIFFESSKELEKQRVENYSKLPLKATEQIYGAIEANVPDKYVYTENTKVVVLDSLKEEKTILRLDKNTSHTVNKLHPILRGTYLYDLYKLK